MVLCDKGPPGSRLQVIMSIAARIVGSANKLNDWVKTADVDRGKRAAIQGKLAERVQALERENRELRQANDIFRKASACIAMAELDCRSE